MKASIVSTVVAAVILFGIVPQAKSVAQTQTAF
jgi:hypothetical protein